MLGTSAKIVRITLLRIWLCIVVLLSSLQSVWITCLNSVHVVLSSTALIYRFFPLTSPRYKLKKSMYPFLLALENRLTTFIFMLMLCCTQKRWSLAIDKTWPTDTMQRLFWNENVYNTWKFGTIVVLDKTRNNELKHKRAKTLNDKCKGKMAVCDRCCYCFCYKQIC